MSLQKANTAVIATLTAVKINSLLHTKASNLDFQVIRNVSLAIIFSVVIVMVVYPRTLEPQIIDVSFNHDKKANEAGLYEVRAIANKRVDSVIVYSDNNELAQISKYSRSGNTRKFVYQFKQFTENGDYLINVSAVRGNEEFYNNDTHLLTVKLKPTPPDPTEGQNGAQEGDDESSVLDSSIQSLEENEGESLAESQPSMSSSRQLPQEAPKETVSTSVDNNRSEESTQLDESSSKSSVPSSSSSKASSSSVSSSTVKYIWGDWSEWSTVQPALIDNRETEAKGQFRLRTKETTTSEQSSLVGWTYEKTESTGVTYGEWSEWYIGDLFNYSEFEVEYKTQYRSRSISAAWTDWSPWQTNEVTESDTRLVETRRENRAREIVVETVNGKENVISQGVWLEWQESPGWAGWPILAYDNIVKKMELDWRTVYRYKDNVLSYGDWSPWSDNTVQSSASNEVEQRSVYRYRSKKEGIIYHYYRYTDWSDWKDGSASTSQNTEGETRTVYRYRDKIPS